MPTYGCTNSKYIHTYIYILNFAGDQVLLAQTHDDMEYMARKQKEEYEKWGPAINLEKNKYVCIGEGKETLKVDGGDEIQPCSLQKYILRYKNRPVGR
jgi:hypothetical protein